MVFQSVNPATGKVLKTFNAYTQAEIEKQLSQSVRALDHWSQTSFSERAALLNQCAHILESETRKYAAIISLEMGKPIKQAEAEISKCALACRYYAEHGAAFLQDEHIKTEAAKSFVSYEPLGAVLAIMPWNFPFWQVFRFLAPALMAGNVGLLKHASNVPQCGLAIQEILEQAGFPEGVFQTLLIGSEAVEALIADDRIKAVTLTGSEGAGSKVAEAAGRALKKTVLELGGSDPFIVLADADLDKAVETAVTSRMINTGQSCIAAKRFILEAPIAEAFLQKMKALMQAKKPGLPLDENCDYGPLARLDLAQSLQKQVDESVAKGASIYLAGGHTSPESAFFKPMILTGIKPGMPAYEEELFGPVALVMIATDAADAIRLANDHKYGLGATIFTNNIQQAEDLARQLESGNVFINAMVQSVPALPFGGIKKSGYGRELSVVGIREFVNQKTIFIR